MSGNLVNFVFIFFRHELCPIVCCPLSFIRSPLFVGGTAVSGSVFFVVATSTDSR